MTFQYLYGPVPSRRLGLSLGLDLVPFKTCSYDCTYCQLGKTTHLTLQRQDHVPHDRVMRELQQKLASNPMPDIITLAGSGEPTLHAGIGDLIRQIKRITSVPVAVLTNGSLLWDPAVQQELAPADIVLPSLDAGDAATFQTVNRPHHHLSFDQMVNGLVDFARHFKHQIRLEVFLLKGIHDHPQAMKNIANWVHRIQPHFVQFNTLARPGSTPHARALHPDLIHSFSSLFHIPCEVIAPGPPQSTATPPDTQALDHDILALLSRRPCTLSDIASGLNLRPNQVLKTLDRLLQLGEVQTVQKDDHLFYRAVPQTPPPQRDSHQESTQS